MRAVKKLADAKIHNEKDQYKALVLQAFDDLEHVDKREFLDRKAAVENASRQKL